MYGWYLSPVGQLPLQRTGMQGYRQCLSTCYGGGAKAGGRL